MVDYRDKENVDEVIGRIKSAPKMKEVFEVIDEIYPSWIVGLSQKYCSDYQSFTDNWKHICRANNVKPQAVLMVDELVFDDEHILLRTLSEVLTCSGFVVRRKGEIIQCSVCGFALPSEEMYLRLKEKGIPNLPNIWSNKCSSC